MSSSIALGRTAAFPSPQNMDFGANALTAPTTPSRRIPVIDKNKIDPEVRKAAEGMEAMFLDYMMKTMRDTVPKNDMDMESPATGIYRTMMDSETAQTAARAGGVGLADQIIAYLEAQRYNLPKGQGIPASDSGTGGTHEGQSGRK